LRSLTVKNVLKISIIFMLLIVSVGSIYAADDLMESDEYSDIYDDFESDDGIYEDFDDDFESDDGLYEEYDDDFEDDFDEDFDEDFEDDSDLVDDIEDDFDEDFDEDFEDDSDLDEDFDEEYYDDSEFDEFDYEEWDDIDFDFEEEDFEDFNFTFFDYEFLKNKIISYLEHNGNSSGVNWTESEDFYTQYKIYLANPENYTLNQSSENYEIALKIYDSITDSFDYFNLTDNETEYLKFLIIYYLNNYGGNLSQYDDYNSKFLHIMAMSGCFSPDKMLNKVNSKNLNNLNTLKTSVSPVNVVGSVIGNQTNTTGNGNFTVTGGVEKDANNPFMFILMLLLFLAVIIFI